MHDGDMHDDDTIDDRTLFDQVLALPPAERAGFVRARCAGDAGRAGRVLALVAAHEREAGTQDRAWTDALPAMTPTMPDWVDTYRILEHLGEGGMGVVYLAEQTEPVRRRVALKILKSGSDSSEVVARFHAERQALALMSHPNIARILEAGMVEGRPYFVMEYVAGMPITEYCDRRRLGIDDRLRLFAKVCRGVQHAHQKGIIHRDLKPTNVLVMDEEGQPVPKIIDFGIAKAIGLKLTEHTVHTEFGRLIGTPEYMSPEQAEMTALDVDTRTDVYALGAILYELLVGERAFDFRRGSPMGLSQIQRTIIEREPERPSTRLGRLEDAGRNAAERRRTDPASLARIVRDDLDWITLKALEKDRTRRYASASELAADIDRSLAGETVNARPPSAAYKTRKFLRRHRLAVTAAGIVAAALVGATLISASFAVGEARQRRRAEDAGEAAVRERDTALAVIDFLTDDMLAAAQPSNRPGRGRDVTMREVLDAAARRIEASSGPGGRFHGKPLVEATIRDALAETYRHLAVLDAAEIHARRALELRRTHLGETHDDTLLATYELGAILRNAGRLADAERLLTRVLEIRTAGASSDDELELADAQAALANVYADQGRHEEAESLNRKALATREVRLGSDDPRTVSIRANLGALLFLAERFDEAEPLLKASLESETRRLGADDPSTLLTKNSLAVLYARTGRTDDAGRLIREVSESAARVYGEDHPNALAAMTNLGRFYVQTGQLERAEPVVHRCLERARSALGESHPTTLSAWDVLARLHETREDAVRAESARRGWLDGWIGQVREREVDAATVNALAWYLLDSGYERLRDPVLALELARRAAGMTDNADPSVLDTLAHALHANGDTAAALARQRAAAALVPADDPRRDQYEAFLAELETAHAAEAGGR